MEEARRVRGNSSFTYISTSKSSIELDLHIQLGRATTGNSNNFCPPPELRIPSAVDEGEAVKETFMK